MYVIKNQNGHYLTSIKIESCIVSCFTTELSKAVLFTSKEADFTLKLIEIPKTFKHAV